MKMLTRRGALAALAASPCAARAAPRPAAGEIVLGQSAPLSGPFAALGAHYRNGALLAIEGCCRCHRSLCLGAGLPRHSAVTSRSHNSQR